jgi:hypothetical protein
MLLVVLLGLAVARARPAAADRIAAGSVVRIEVDEIYLNLGTSDGIRAGAELRLKRPVRLKHPVSGAWIQDWIPLGAATVREVGARLSMARVDGELLAQLAVGDRVEIYVDQAVAAPPPPPTDGAPLPAVDPATARVLAMWRDSASLSLDQRIAAWERFLAGEPDSPFAAALREDIELLRQERDAMRAPEDTARGRALGGLLHNSPGRAPAGRPIELAFLIDEPGELSSAWLHYRRQGDATYHRALLERHDDLYLRVELPASVVAAPGVEYFVEIATTRGEVGTAVADAERPLTVAVDEPPLTRGFTGEHGRSQVALRVDYIDFANLDRRDGDHRDRFATFEADVLYRIGRRIWGVRTGFGSVQGEGGFANRTYAAGETAPPTGFNYGYAEVEVGLLHRLGAAARLVAGVGQDGFGSGIEGRLRLGRPEETNLALSASHVAELGSLSELRLEVHAFDRMPLGLAVAVTDLPLGGELGVRLAADIGWRAASWLTPTVRLSYQARTVDHAGVGAGLGMVFGW